MALPIKGKVATSGYQGIQGMAKGSAAVMGDSGKVGVKNNGVAAKGKTGTMQTKSKKKKVIVNALLAAMRGGHMSKQLASSGNMGASNF